MRPLTTCVLLFCGIGIAPHARHANAAVLDELRSALDRPSMPAPPASLPGAKARLLYLNGARIWVTTAATPTPVAQVLDFYQERYPGGKMAQRAGGPAALRTEGESSGQVLTAEVHDEGALRKLEQGLIPLLAAGPVRMVHAQHFGEYTHSVAVSFEGPLPASLLRSEGDNSAPGQDPSGLSRPPGVRTLTLVDPESRFALAIYRTELDSAAALDAASAQLRSAGYERDDRFASVASSQGRSLLRFTRKDQEVVVSAHVPHTDPHSTMLVYLSRSAQIPRFFPMIGR